MRHFAFNFHLQHFHARLIKLISVAQSDSIVSQKIMSVTTISSESPNANHSQQLSQTSDMLPLKKRIVSNLADVTKCDKRNDSDVKYTCGQEPAKGDQQEQQKPFCCNICGGSFFKYSSLCLHKELHRANKNNECAICGLALATASYLKVHYRIHTGEKPYKCATCAMQFSQSSNLKRHGRTHSRDKIYVCEICHKGFAHNTTLCDHRRIHTEEKPYKCDLCGSSFRQPNHLKTHRRVHSGEKPFKCDICSKAFGHSSALKSHQKIHEICGQTAPHQPAHVQLKALIVPYQELPEIEEEDKKNVNEVKYVLPLNVINHTFM